jgi:hypothetical protein
LQLEELRKAQRDLTDAFSFRRSINVDAESDPFATNVATPRGESSSSAAAAASSTAVQQDAAITGGQVGATIAATAAVTPTQKKKIRRRKVVVAEPESTPVPVASSSLTGSIPDLEMPQDPYVNADPYVNVDPYVNAAATISTSASNLSAEELAEIDREFDQYTTTLTEPDDWYGVASSSSSSSAQKSNPEYLTSLSTTTTLDDASAEATSSSSRFQQQLSGNWNEQVLANQDKLSPLAKVMEMLAVLEKEKIAASQRLEEEFRKRAEVEDSYYQKQRRLLEEAATQVQTDAFVGADNNDNTKKSGFNMW